MVYKVNAYKIYWEDEPENSYIGSTQKTLSGRAGQHRTTAKLGATSRLYTTMREKGLNTFKYVMLGSCMVSNMDEQRMFEQTYIDKLKPKLNQMSAYKKNGKPQTITTALDDEIYRQNHRICECGGHYVVSRSKQHFATQKRKEYMSK